MNYLAHVEKQFSDYFLNIDTRGEEQAAEDEAFEAWVVDQDFLFLLNAEAADLLNDAWCGVDISAKVDRLVRQKYQEHVQSYLADCAFDEAQIWD